jgi:putative ABC transport system permease protein
VVNLAIKSLLHDKLRFGLTVAGLGFSVTLVVVQVGLFLGMLDNASLVIDKTDADIWISSKNTPNVDFGHAFSERSVGRVRSTPGIARAENLVVFYFDITLPSGREERVVGYAMRDFRVWGLPWNVAEGNVDDLKRGPFVMLDRSAERRFGPFEVGDYREMSGQRVRIVGKTEDAMSFTTLPVVFLDHAMAQQLAPAVLKNRTMYIVAKLAPGADSESVRSELRRRLRYNDVWTRREWSEKTRRYWVITVGLGFNMLLTVGLGCLVGVAVVAQMLYTSTIKQLPEFGTLKAIGANNCDIYLILGRQALICAVLGFVAGLGPPLVLRPLVEDLDLKLLMPPWLILAVFVGTILLCLGSAVLSFRKVASIDPAMVFRG